MLQIIQTPEDIILATSLGIMGALVLVIGHGVIKDYLSQWK